MKRCIYCAELIEDKAVKCPKCHSSQIPSNSRRNNNHAAKLVISFVGIMALLLGVGGSILGVIGYKNISDLRSENEEQVEILKQHNKTVVDLENKLSLLGSDMEELVIRQMSDRADYLLDRVRIGSLERTRRFLDQFYAIGKRLENIQTKNKNAEKARQELVKLYSAIKAFEHEKYETALSNLEQLERGFLENGRWPIHIQAYRWKTAALNRLHERARTSGAPDHLINQALANWRTATDQYLQVAEIYSTKEFLAKANAILPLLYSKNSADLDRAKILHCEQLRAKPTEIDIVYNMAAAEATRANLDGELSPEEADIVLALLNAYKGSGGFDSEADKTFFWRDSDFSALMNHDNNLIKPRYESLLNSPRDKTKKEFIKQYCGL